MLHIIKPFNLPNTGPNALQSIFALFLALCLILYASAVSASVSDLFERGLKAARQGDLSRAILIWSEVIEKSPDSYAPRLNRGVAHIKSGFIVRGIQDWRKAMDLAPIFAYPTDCGEFVQGFKGRGNVDFVKSVELDQGLVVSVAMAGATLIDLGKSDQAADLYNKSMELTRNPLLKNRFAHWANSLSR
jgi:tetratricopeptide (TPR) repeat protein